MTTVRKTSSTTYRDRMKRQGLVRVEVQVCREYAGLVRDVASALANLLHERGIVVGHATVRSR